MGVLVKVVKSVHEALRKMQLDKMPDEKKPQVKRMVTYFFYVIQEAFKAYGKKDLDGKGIRLFQEALVSIGCVKCAEHVFKVWSEARLAEAKAAEDAAAAAEKEKGGKDDKKKGKEKDKKEDKKKDKDDKK